MGSGPTGRLEAFPGPGSLAPEPKPWPVNFGVRLIGMDVKAQAPRVYKKESDVKYSLSVKGSVQNT